MSEPKKVFNIIFGIGHIWPNLTKINLNIGKNSGIYFKENKQEKISLLFNQGCPAD